MVGMCQFRTGVLFIGFLLGFMEVTMGVVYYTWRAEFLVASGYDPNLPEYDVIAIVVVIFVDLIVNILMISGANKDYSGRRKDLR